MPETAISNLPEFSVTELSAALKRSVEEQFALVRVRGEISGLKFHSSGHVYFDLKDDKAVLNAVIWRGVAQRMKVRPEAGLEVICTGKLSTYAGSSRYQLIVEQVDLAGLGALMAMLEARRKALAAEGDRLDAVLLGMGEDGHICSMFPNSPTLKTLLTPTLKPTVLGVPHGRDGMAPTIERLSINLPYLMSAGRVILGLKGAAKRRVFEEQAAGDPNIQPIAALIAAGVPLEVLWSEEG